ncbi:uncharacterized protein LOC122023071 [Zingiber officinale]|uniref:uncharacterized protein LOC122023071 n=1 Tax=Zingiber officinale TaxID=94328 RepID=UPI001C4C250A|nr:uncharacterized protein LOC122023071 [Zingiber officinale]
MISGGPTDGDSCRAHKSHERRLEIHAVGCSQEQDAGPVISFGPQDLEGLELPHDDALIIKAVIANRRVARVFVDTGSSINVLFISAFEEMQIDASELQPVATSLYGFTGNEVKTMGQIKLAISLGSEPLIRTRRSTFIVVDSPSSYNVILGRLALHEFRVAVFIFHQKIKFPVGEQVSEVRGEQKVSRRCYIDMVKVEAHKAQRTHDGVVHAIQKEPMPIAEEPIPCEEIQLYSERLETLTRIAGDLPPELKEDLIQCLIRNRDVFTWSTEELLGVKSEVAKHRIDQLVDSTTGCERICMLDVYQGYHQIPLAVEDQEKVSFITADGTFCYTVMPFGLRNVGATYQRMMDKIFREQAGHNVEVYVDDILIKSLLAANLIADVEETCGTLQ